MGGFSSSSPENLNGVLPDFTVARDQRQAFCLSLGHEYAVEWVAVVEWKALHREDMVIVDGQCPQSQPRSFSWNQSVRRFGDLQPSKRILDGDLPNAGCGKIKIVLRVRQCFPRRQVEARHFTDTPQPNIGVDEEFQDCARFLAGFPDRARAGTLRFGSSA